MECETLYELGPPPDMILNIPPPPIPPFMEEFVARLAAEGINIHEDDNGFPEEEKSCNLCQWANGNGVGFVELAQKGELMFFICCKIVQISYLIFIPKEKSVYTRSALVKKRFFFVCGRSHEVESERLALRKIYAQDFSFLPVELSRKKYYVYTL